MASQMFKTEQVAQLVLVEPEVVPRYKFFSRPPSRESGRAMA